MIPVEGYKNLFRDENTGAIINCSDDEYNSYIKTRDERKNQRNEINQLKSDIEEIKNMLKTIIDK